MASSPTPSSSRKSRLESRRKDPRNPLAPGPGAAASARRADEQEEDGERRGGQPEAGVPGAPRPSSLQGGAHQQRRRQGARGVAEVVEAQHLAPPLREQLDHQGVGAAVDQPAAGAQAGEQRQVAREGRGRPQQQPARRVQQGPRGEHRLPAGQVGQQPAQQAEQGVAELEGGQDQTHPRRADPVGAPDRRQAGPDRGEQQPQQAEGAESGRNDGVAVADHGEGAGRRGAGAATDGAAARRPPSPSSRPLVTCRTRRPRP